MVSYIVPARTEETVEITADITGPSSEVGPSDGDTVQAYRFTGYSAYDPSLYYLHQELFTPSTSAEYVALTSLQFKLSMSGGSTQPVSVPETIPESGSTVDLSQYVATDRLITSWINGIEVLIAESPGVVARLDAIDAKDVIQNYMVDDYYLDEIEWVDRLPYWVIREQRAAFEKRADGVMAASGAIEVAYIEPAIQYLSVSNEHLRSKYSKRYFLEFVEGVIYSIAGRFNTGQLPSLYGIDTVSPSRRTHPKDRDLDKPKSDFWVMEWLFRDWTTTVMALLTEYKIQNPAQIPVRRMNNISRQAMHSIGIKWITDFNRPHYMTGAAGKYGYQKRKPKYNARKQRQRGHQTPLVWSGRTKAAALGSLFPRSTPKRVRANIPAPHYVKIRSMRGRPPVGDEMTRTASSDNQALSQVYYESMNEQMAAYIEGKKK